jgi:predicted acylesterase/phospholipase RssA
MRALVLSGGGPDGLFAHGGALHALGRAYHKPPRHVFDRLSGASAGALAAALAAVGHEPQILKYAETIRPEDLFRSDRPFRTLRRARRLHDEAALLDPRGLRQLIEDELATSLLGDIPALQLVIPTCDLRSQRMVEWRPEDCTGSTFRKALLGSASIPILLPAVRLVYQGKRYELVDGGTTHNHPVELVLPELWNAQKADGDVELVVISTLQPPEEADLPRGGVARVMAVIQRTAALVMNELASQRFDEAEEMHIPQRWIQVRSPDLDLENFDYTDALTAYKAGFEAVENHYLRRPAR